MNKNVNSHRVWLLCGIALGCLFLVKGNGINHRSFKMYIYDRWGEVIFETEDLYQGWDGRIKGGDIGKNGTYTWLCTYRTTNGTEYQKAGAVTIIR